MQLKDLINLNGAKKGKKPIYKLLLTRFDNFSQADKICTQKPETFPKVFGALSSNLAAELLYQKCKNALFVHF